MTNDKRWENLPGTEFLKTTEKILQNPTERKIEEERLKDEQAKQRFSEFQDAFQANAQKQHTDEVARQKTGLVLQAKQNTLTEQSIALSKWAIGIAIVGAGIALLSLTFSIWTLFGRC